MARPELALLSSFADDGSASFGRLVFCAGFLVPWGIRFSSEVNFHALRFSCPIRPRAAVLAAECALWLMCGPAWAKSQDSSGPAQSAKAAPKATLKSGAAATHKKAASPTSTSPAKKSAGGTAAKSGSHAGTASHATSSKRKRSNSHTVASKGKKPRGQQKIDSERVQAIQEALIREHYLTGEASGSWNQSSEDAMRQYQADHGWQSKTVPDSRALIKLGLGPSHDHLLNPESAMTTAPDAPRGASLTPASHSADPGPRVNTTTAPADPAPTPAAGTPAPQ